MDSPAWSALHQELEKAQGKSACANVYFQHLVAMEYFREHTGFGQDESTDI
jgi:hypothetical protein